MNLRTRLWASVAVFVGFSWMLVGTSGDDPNFSGRYLNVRMASGYEVHLSQSPSQPVDIAATKKWYADGASGFEGLVVDSADAIVAARNEPAPIGEYWETTVCSPVIDGHPLCVSSAGARVEGSKVTKLTHDEVLALVVMARSIEVRP